MDQSRLLHWCGDAWEEHLSFKFVQVLLWSGINSGSCTGTQVTNVPPAVLAGEAFQKVTLIALWVASEVSKVLMMKSWTSVRDTMKSPLMHPHPMSVVEPRGTSVMPASVRDRLSLTRKEKLLV